MFLRSAESCRLTQIGDGAVGTVADIDLMDGQSGDFYQGTGIIHIRVAGHLGFQAADIHFETVDGAASLTTMPAAPTIGDESGGSRRLSKDLRNVEEQMILDALETAATNPPP